MSRGAFEKQIPEAGGRLYRPSGSFCAIASPGEIRWTYRRRTHASSFAEVLLGYEPADGLRVTFAALWPAQLGPEYAADLNIAIASGLYAALVEERAPPAWAGSGDAPPRVGVYFVVREVGWDDVGSSEAAFYRAAREAALHLAVHGEWQVVEW
jgi:hypothetical protein